MKKPPLENNSEKKVSIPETLQISEPIAHIATVIEKAQMKAFQAVNREMIDMYWEIGRYISEKAKNENWGRSLVASLAKAIQQRFVGIRGFSASNIWRMQRFYELYAGNEKLAPLVREISWSHNLLIMEATKTDEAREFYLTLCIKNQYSKRELERQIDSLLFERTMISAQKNQLIIAQNPALSTLRDSYVLEFLAISEQHSEKDLRKSIVTNLKAFILEFGKDFTFMGEEYRIQVGKTDFFIDLLFYNRSLACLVAIELKVERFKPEHMGQLQFYLEALDRDIKKENENPSVGLILCTSKDDTVVEYALSRTLSPTLVADYQLHLPDKKILQTKLRELAEMAEINDDEIEE
jgi:predicted nuclease of restriction endonuclease-like (RecB) superfamily